MSPEAVLGRILPAVERLLKEVVERAVASGTPTLYELETLTQAVLPRSGQVVLQEVAVGQGSGLVGPSRSCGCGGNRSIRIRRGGWWCGPAWAISAWTDGRTIGGRRAGRPVIHSTSSWAWGKRDG